jgi:hypothetical protein
MSTAGVKNFVVSLVIKQSSTEQPPNMGVYQTKLNGVLVDVRPRSA